MRTRLVFWITSTVALLAALVALALIQSVPSHLRTEADPTDSPPAAASDKSTSPPAQEETPPEGACYLRHTVTADGKRTSFTTCGEKAEKECKADFERIRESFGMTRKEVKVTDDDPLKWWVKVKTCPSIETRSLRLLDPGIVVLRDTEQAAEKLCLETLKKKKILCPDARKAEGSFQDGGVAEGPTIIYLTPAEDFFSAYCKIVKYCK